MSNLDIIRAWKDEEFRRTLTADQRAQLPGHPAGNIEIQDTEDWDSVGLGPRSPCTRCGTTR